jgi:hypothetical protein
MADLKQPTIYAIDDKGRIAEQCGKELESVGGDASEEIIARNTSGRVFFRDKSVVIVAKFPDGKEHEIATVLNDTGELMAAFVRVRAETGVKEPLPPKVEGE